MYLPESLPRLNPIKGSAQIKEAILTIKASVNTEHQFTEYLDGLDTMIYDSLSDIADDSCLHLFSHFYLHVIPLLLFLY